jgi:D-arabinose 1-dehydrogenase-like Zn-dependent alcohol dehydrogenase
MRAMAVTSYGEPLAPIDAPEPVLPDRYALIEILTCGVCFSDVKTSRGHMPFSEELVLPHIPGHEIFGRVLRTEPPGLVEEGLRAIVYHYWPCGRCPACRRGDETLCARLVGWAGFTHQGGFAERIAVPVDRLIPVPDAIDPVHAAPMSCALGTAYRSVVTRGGVDSGSTCVIVGLGGVGIHAAQVARAAGATVVGLDVREPALATARALDLDARRSDDAEAIADLALTNGEGIDLVVDTVGHDDTLETARSMVRKGGRVVAVGYSPTSLLRVPTSSLVLDEVDYIGSRFARRDDLSKAVSLVERGLVGMVVGLVRPLEGINEVFRALEEGSVMGRAVLQIAPDTSGVV